MAAVLTEGWTLALGQSMLQALWRPGWWERRVSKATGKTKDNAVLRKVTLSKLSWPPPLVNLFAPPLLVQQRHFHPPRLQRRVQWQLQKPLA